MPNPKSSLVVALFVAGLFTFGFCAAAQNAKLTAREARDHVGEVQTVCGKLASTHYAADSKGQPTFLNLDEPYPKEIFTNSDLGSDRSIRNSGIEIPGRSGVRER